MDKSKQTQIDKYGGPAGYSAEMKRRRALVKKPGFAAMDKQKHREISRLGGFNRWQKKPASK